MCLVCWLSVRGINFPGRTRELSNWLIIRCIYHLPFTTALPCDIKWHIHVVKIILHAALVSRCWRANNFSLEPLHCLAWPVALVTNHKIQTKTNNNVLLLREGKILTGAWCPATRQAGVEGVGGGRGRRRLQALTEDLGGLKLPCHCSSSCCSQSLVE